MKILLFSIFLMTVGVLVVLSAQNVKAMPDMSPQDLYKQSDMVFYGQVITKESGPGPDYYYYQVEVSTFFKNPQSSDSITVAGHKPSEGHMAYPQFEVGDKVVFYIVKQDGILVASPWSIKAGEGCDIHAFLGPAPIAGEPIVRGPPSPLEQVTDVNITTRGPFKVNQALLVSYHVWNNFPQSRNVTVQLVIKTEDGSPACVKSNTVQKLIERGWATPAEFTSRNESHEVHSSINQTIAIGNATYDTIEFQTITGNTVYLDNVKFTYHGAS